MQRTAQFSLPCASPPLTEEDHAELRARYPEHREWQRSSYAATSMNIDTPFGAPYIQTRHGIGYRIAVPDAG